MTATYTLKVKTPASIINSSGSLRSPEQYAVLCCLLAGQLSDDSKLLKAAPTLLNTEILARDTIGPWLSAALDPESGACPEFKSAIEVWMTANQMAIAAATGEHA